MLPEQDTQKAQPRSSGISARDQMQSPSAKHLHHSDSDGPAKNIFHGPQHANSIAERRIDKAMFDVRSHDEGRAATRIDMISAILRVVFNHKDERAVFVAAVSDSIHHKSYCVIVVGNL